MLIARGLLLLIILLLIWQAIVYLFGIPPYLLPYPSQVATSLIRNRDLLLSNSGPTLVEILLGLSVGTLLGILCALLMMIFKPVRFWLLPVMIISQAIPTFAIAPILVLWLGYGLAAKIITVSLMLFFPIANAFFEGLTSTPAEWLEMAKIMGGSQLAVLTQIRIPAALPFLAAGIRIATVLAPIGAIVSEWIGASQGLGFLMLNANARLDIELMFACLILIVFFSLLLYLVINGLLRAMVRT